MTILDPWGGTKADGSVYPAHIPQCKYLEVDRSAVKGTSMTHYVGGRGCAKTTTGIIWMLRTVLHNMPGVRGFWSEPRGADFERIFIPELRKICPEEDGFWSLVTKQGGARQLRFSNGTVVDLVSRNVDNAQKKVGIGPNYGWGFSDEAAERFDMQKHLDMMAAIRVEGLPYRFFDTLSTPQRNGYYDWVHNDSAVIIHSTSYENPHVSQDSIKTVASMMDENYLAQEIGGQFINLTGAIWHNFEEKPWPEGNIAEHIAWDPTQPFYIAMDLGSASWSVQVIQYHEPIDPKSGRRMFDGRLAVVVGEMLPNNMNLDEVMPVIQEQYCSGVYKSPLKVITGHDGNTRGATGMSANQMFAQWGWNNTMVTHPFDSKQLQQVNLSSMLLNNAGHRRLAVAAGKNSKGQYELKKRHFQRNKSRGILNMFRNDTFPDVRSDDVFIKDKGKGATGANNMEDDRDCILYAMVDLHKPQWAFNLNNKR